GELQDVDRQGHDPADGLGGEAAGQDRRQVGGEAHLDVLLPPGLHDLDDVLGGDGAGGDEQAVGPGLADQLADAAPRPEHPAVVQAQVVHAAGHEPDRLEAELAGLHGGGQPLGLQVGPDDQGPEGELADQPDWAGPPVPQPPHGQGQDQPQPPGQQHPQPRERGLGPERDHHRGRDDQADGHAEGAELSGGGELVDPVQPHGQVDHRGDQGHGQQQQPEVDGGQQPVEAQLVGQQHGEEHGQGVGDAHEDVGAGGG